MAVVSYSRCEKCGGEIRDIDTGSQVYFEPCKKCAAQQSAHLTGGTVRRFYQNLVTNIIKSVKRILAASR